MFDNNLFFRTSGAGSMSSTETSSAITINETPIGGLSVNVIIPKRDVGDTVQVTLQHSTDNSTYTTLYAFDTVASITATNTTAIRLRQRVNTRAKYLRTVSTVAGTSPDFGAVQIFLGDRDYPNNYQVTAAATPNTY